MVIRSFAPAGNVVADALRELSAKPGEQLRRDRRQRYLDIGRQL